MAHQDKMALFSYRPSGLGGRFRLSDRVPADPLCAIGCRRRWSLGKDDSHGNEGPLSETRTHSTE